MAHGMSGRSVIVTGAARGIGLAVARRFVRAGAHVTMADSDQVRLEREADALAGMGHDGKVQPFVGDLTEKLSMANLMAATLDAFDGIDVVVNASRLLVGSDPLDPENDRIEASLAQNVTASLRLTQIAARRMIERAADAPEPTDRSIVHLSSVLARRSSPELLAYSVSCAALEQLTRVLALALAPQHIRVNAIAVGGVPSHALAAALPDIEDLSEVLADNTPVGRAGGPDECAEAALFLASPAASFITGQILGVDGGRSLTDPVLLRRE